MKGNSSLYLLAGPKSAEGGISYMDGKIPDDRFTLFAELRAEIDANGFFDVIAHGNADCILIRQTGRDLVLDARSAAKLIKKAIKGKSWKGIRLLSCNTGSTEFGFAQNLANALGLEVIAPTKTLICDYKGNFKVGYIDDPGEFKTFKPGGFKK